LTHLISKDVKAARLEIQSWNIDLIIEKFGLQQINLMEREFA